MELFIDLARRFFTSSNAEYAHECGICVPLTFLLMFGLYGLYYLCSVCIVYTIYIVEISGDITDAGRTDDSQPTREDRATQLLIYEKLGPATFLLFFVS